MSVIGNVLVNERPRGLISVGECNCEAILRWLGYMERIGFFPYTYKKLH